MPSPLAIRDRDDLDRALTPEQKRFNTLLRQIGQARAKLAAWQAGVGPYRQARAAVQEPLVAEFRVLARRHLLALDAASSRRGWTRAQQATLSDLVCEGAGHLLNLDETDAEMRALYERHAQSDYADDRADALREARELAELLTGVDLRGDEDVRDEADLLERLHRELGAQHEATTARRAARAARKGKTPAQQRREDEAREALQSVREIFRKLASSLHPDRELDPVQREVKTALMQRANHAYERNDLLALLELQLEIEQIDAAHAAQADPRRLKHYNKVLAEQLAELKTEIEREEMTFRMEFGVDIPGTLNPDKLGRVLEDDTRELRGVIARTEREIALLDDMPAAKRWLKRERSRLEAMQLERAMGIDFPF